MSTELFRFLHARRPRRRPKCQVQDYITNHVENDHPLLVRLAEKLEAGANEDVLSLAVAFFHSDDFRDAAPQIDALAELSEAFGEGRFSSADELLAAIRSTLGTDAVPAGTNNGMLDFDGHSAWVKLRSTIIVAYIANLHRPSPGNRLGIYTFGRALIMMASAECLGKPDAPAVADVARAGRDAVLDVPDDLVPQRSDKTTRPSQDSCSDDITEKPISARQATVSRPEMGALEAGTEAVAIRSIVDEIDRVLEEERIEANRRSINLAPTPSTTDIRGADKAQPLPEPLKSIEPRVATLSAEAEHLLAALELDERSLAAARDTLAQRAAELSAVHLSTHGPHLNIVLPGGIIDLGPARPPLSLPDRSRATLIGAREAARILGVADLRVVRHEPVSYELGEIAHIQNVLDRQFLERVHLRRSSTMVESDVSASKKTVDERDTETTTRFEMESAMQSSASLSAGVQVGASVSGTYGLVTYGADVSGSLETSVSTARQTASVFAHETVDRVRRRVEESVSERRRTITRTEFEETNTHRIDNTDDSSDHITAVYRWVNQKRRVELVNYGPRLLVECYIPEPAAVLRRHWSQGIRNQQTVNRPRPFEILDLWSGQIQPIEPRHITPDNYLMLASLWDAPGIEPPPTPFITKSHSFNFPEAAQDQTKLATGSQTHVVSIDERYVMSKAFVTMTALFPSDVNKTASTVAMVAVGDNMIQLKDNPMGNVTQGARKNLAHTFFFNLSGPSFHGPEVPLAASVQYEHPIAVVCDITCSRTTFAYHDWQLRTFELLRTAFSYQQQEYEERVAAARVNATDYGTNPAESRAIEARELKRGAIEALIPTRFDEFGAVTELPDYPHTSYPIDIPSNRWPLREQVRRVTFFEQVFDWGNINATYYPYFWGRKQSWPELLSTEAPDPLHQAFLEAGSALVILPVKEGFERYVIEYFRRGRIWGGEDPPTAASESDALLLGELADQRLTSQEGVIEDRWEVTLPTSLVYLQGQAEMPITLTRGGNVGDGDGG